MDDHLIILQENIVYLCGNASKIVEYSFRLIEMQRKSDNKIIYFLTNITLEQSNKYELMCIAKFCVALHLQ